MAEEIESRFLEVYVKRTGVTSSIIKSVGYDSLEKRLEVEFVNGSVYEYNGVPGYVYSRLMTTSSVGSYFHNTVKGFGGVKISSEESD